MRNYTQLTEEQRYQIYEGITLGLTQTKIADDLEVDRSTISRELNVTLDYGVIAPGKLRCYLTAGR